MAEEQKRHSWWATIPGVLTASAGLITAVSGLVLALHQTGFFDDKESISTNQQPASEITQEKIKKSKCSAPWKWDTGVGSCAKKVTLAKKNYAVLLDRPITKVDGRIDFYLNKQRLEGTDGEGRAIYKASRGTIQVVIPIMQGSTMVGDMREVIYSTSEGGICNVSGLTETTGWMKKMRVSYIILLPDCGQVDKTCHARLDSSRKRVQIGMKPLTVTISKSC